MKKDNKGQRKGLAYEYRIMSLFQEQGYLSRRGIPLLNSNNQDATDIDILGIKFLHPFKEHKIICDCKNKKSPRPYERIFWTKGLSEFIDVEDVFVALPKASEEIIKFANQGNVRILTEEIINNYMNGNNEALGIADETFYKNRLTLYNNRSKEGKQINKFYIDIKLLYNYSNSYVAFNRAIHMLSQASKKVCLYEPISDKQNIYFTWKYLSYELIVIIAILFLRICSDTLVLPKETREKHIKLKLAYGDIEPNKANELIRSITNLSNEILKKTMQINNIKNFQLIDLGQINSPKYASGITNLVEKMLTNPEYYIELPQVIDYMLFECALKESDFSYENFEIKFGKTYSKEKIKAAKNIFAIVQTYSKVNIKDIWKKTSNEK